MNMNRNQRGTSILEKNIKELYLNDEKIWFHEAFADPIGGPEGPVVVFISGIVDLKVGETLPFKGYNITTDRIIIPKTLNLSKEISAKIIFESNEIFTGTVGHSAARLFQDLNDSLLYEKVLLTINI
ncbi:hypothetical protein D3C87_78310 [compost metagenome]